MFWAKTCKIATEVCGVPNPQLNLTHVGYPNPYPFWRTSSEKVQSISVLWPEFTNLSSFQFHPHCDLGIMDSRPVYLQGRGRGRGRGINPQAPAFQSYPYQQQQYEPSVPNKEYFAQTNYYNGTFGGPGAPGGKQVLPTRQSPEDCSPEGERQ